MPSAQTGTICAESFKQKDEDFDALIDVKIALAMEIKAYRELLEGEERRLGFPAENGDHKDATVSFVVCVCAEFKSALAAPAVDGVHLDGRHGPRHGAAAQRLGRVDQPGRLGAQELQDQAGVQAARRRPRSQCVRFICFRSCLLLKLARDAQARV